MQYGQMPPVQNTEGTFLCSVVVVAYALCSDFLLVDCPAVARPHFPRFTNFLRACLEKNVGFIRTFFLLKFDCFEFLNKLSQRIAQSCFSCFHDELLVSAMRSVGHNRSPLEGCGG